MVAQGLLETVDALSFEERAELADYIVQTLDPDDFALTPEQEQMLASRIASMDADPSIGVAWAEVKARFESKWG